MATVDDRWHRTLPDGTKTRTARYGTGKRWAARWRDLDGAQRSKSFTRRADAEAFAATVRTQLDAGSYVAPPGRRVRSARSGGPR